MPSLPQHASAVSLPTPALYAHRGSTVLAPENTATAFDLALSYGADVLEIDVRLSRDNVVIVTHDEALERTTNGTGLVRSMQAADLVRLDAGYRYHGLQGEITRGRHIRLLTLSELFERYPSVGINIDIKDADSTAARAVADVIERYPDADWVNVGSFHGDVIRAFRQMAPTVATAASQSEVAALYFGRFFNQSGRVPFQRLQIPTRYFGLPLATRRFISHVQQLDIGMVYWTINDKEQMQNLLAKGVDGLVTDRVDIAGPLMGKSGSTP